MVGYNVIIADMLVGSAPHYSGMLPTLLARHDGPWWLSRPFVLAALMVLVVAPTLVSGSQNGYPAPGWLGHQRQAMRCIARRPERAKSCLTAIRPSPTHRRAPQVLRSLRAVARFSSFSVCMLFVLASAIAGLALTAVAQGKVAPGVQWLPSAHSLGGSPLSGISSILTVVSVSALAFTCQVRF